MFLPLWILGFLSILLFLLIYIVFILYSKFNIIYDINEEYRDLFSQLKEEHTDALNEMRELDQLGAFEESDQLGYFFNYVKTFLMKLENYFTEG